MTKAEERALEAYPHDYPERTGFRQGYEQAEKDLALTWEDIYQIRQIMTEVYNTDPNELLDDKAYYSKVLQKFNEYK